MARARHQKPPAPLLYYCSTQHCPILTKCYIENILKTQEFQVRVDFGGDHTLHICFCAQVYSNMPETKKLKRGFVCQFSLIQRAPRRYVSRTTMDTVNAMLDGLMGYDVDHLISALRTDTTEHAGFTQHFSWDIDSKPVLFGSTNVGCYRITRYRKCKDISTQLCLVSGLLCTHSGNFGIVDYCDARIYKTLSIYSIKMRTVVS